MRPWFAPRRGGDRNVRQSDVRPWFAPRRERPKCPPERRRERHAPMVRATKGTTEMSARATAPHGSRHEGDDDGDVLGRALGLAPPRRRPLDALRDDAPWMRMVGTQ